MGVTTLAGKYTGKGVTIGIVSTSFDSEGFDSLGTPFTRAADDAAAGNLPGPGNPNGDLTPVLVLSEPPFKGETDLGRVMAQVIYGIAPKAKLCFASSDTVSYADAVASLTSANGQCKANIIVEADGFDPGDGAFSEGAASAAIAQAVNAGVTFIVASGNAGPATYNGTFKAVSDSAARAGSFGNLQLSQVPAELTAGGFHDFSTSGAPQISYGLHEPVEAFSMWELDWDDPSDAAKITAEYKFLVFDEDGNYLASQSGLNHKNGAGPNGQAVGAEDGDQFAISLAAPATSATATRLRITNVFDDAPSGASSTTGLPAQPSGPSVFGHQASVFAISVSSHSKDDPATPEAFNSCGPFTSAFDSTGNRLATPEVRLKPDLAGIDGVDATLFPSSVPQPFNDTDKDGFSNVSGSAVSAAAVAAIAALTIEAAGGAATPGQVATWLQKSTGHPSTWMPCDGYGLVNASRATALAADARAQPPVTPVDPGFKAAASGCGTAGSMGGLWGLAVAALLAARKRR